MVDEGCRGEKAYGDILVVHNHEDLTGIDSGDLIVHGDKATLKNGIWIGIKKENARIPTWVRISLDDAVEVAATLMWAAQFKE